MEDFRIAFILIDGVGDVNVRQFGFLTPLQLANVPTLDAVSAAGLNGLIDPVEPGLACGSDTAHLSIFGYEPRRYYRGRGAFESMGAGIHMNPGDIAFKCNFATLDEDKGIVIRRRADRRFEDVGPILCAALDGANLPSFPEHKVSLRYATEHRCGVVVRGPGLSDAVSDTDPLRDQLPLRRACPLDDTPEASHTAAVVNEVSAVFASILREHPVNKERRLQNKPLANIVLLRGCGTRVALASFEEAHGLRACMVAPTRIIAGLGLSLHIHQLEAPGATGDYRTSFQSKAATLAHALSHAAYNFGFLHVKAVDDTGHDRASVLKVGYLEAVDKMVRQLLRRLWEAELAGAGRYAVCVTADHSTPVVFGDHSHEPVPFVMAHVRYIALPTSLLAAECGLIQKTFEEPLYMPHKELDPFDKTQR
eukprot:jgi/Botrbrau1/8627/Bobra.0196s0021.2